MATRSAEREAASTIDCRFVCFVAFVIVLSRYYTNLRHRFLRRKSAHLRTIVVQGVPKEMRSDSKLFTYFNTLYPEEVLLYCCRLSWLVARQCSRERHILGLLISRFVLFCRTSLGIIDKAAVVLGEMTNAKNINVFLRKNMKVFLLGDSSDCYEVELWALWPAPVVRCRR